jgi:hypothetical protein
MQGNRTRRSRGPKVGIVSDPLRFPEVCILVFCAAAVVKGCLVAPRCRVLKRFNRMQTSVEYRDKTRHYVEDEKQNCRERIHRFCLFYLAESERKVHERYYVDSEKSKTAAFPQCRIRLQGMIGWINIPCSRTMTSGYYTNKLSGERLRRCYEVAPPRTKAYLEAEISFALDYLDRSTELSNLGAGMVECCRDCSRRRRPSREYTLLLPVSGWLWIFWAAQPPYRLPS